MNDMPDQIPDQTPDLTMETTAPYDRDAIFHADGPINPLFITEAIRTLMRNLPIDPKEPPAWANRRMFCALVNLAAYHPRDETEVTLAVQALSAYHAAAACFRIGMNLRDPNGDSTRHITAACSAARTFDSLLRALERRQAKPLSVPVGRPPSRPWSDPKPDEYMDEMETRCRHGDLEPESQPDPQIAWTPEQRAAFEALREQRRIDKENEGLDIANTEGILPGGGMILMENPTPQQAAYMGRRLGLMYKREIEENRRKGITKMPKIRGIRPGDLIP
ncbi:hypothetical protein [Acidisphaera sp. S103]|uniref:hypothetical protein n=1 Tax=Acidisphaera sp. S103 TaxID=1747223 RepID=UPI00131ADFF5|nr:hypothetical protein [Acidisphaera sp. S103]